MDFVAWLADWEAVRTAVVTTLAITAGAVLWRRIRQRRQDPAQAVELATVPVAAPVPSPAGQATATEMLATVADMRTHLASLDTIHPQAPRRLADSIPASERAAAHLAQGQMERQTATHAILLPPDLSQRWANAVSLLAEYSRGATQGPDRWPSHLVNRAQTDVDNYLQYLAKSLAEYVKHGTITKECNPPVLRRDDMESWQPC